MRIPLEVSFCTSHDDNISSMKGVPPPVAAPEAATAWTQVVAKQKTVPTRTTVAVQSRPPAAWTRAAVPKEPSHKQKVVVPSKRQSSSSRPAATAPKRILAPPRVAAAGIASTTNPKPETAAKAASKPTTGSDATAKPAASKPKTRVAATKPMAKPAAAKPVAKPTAKPVTAAPSKKGFSTANQEDFPALSQPKQPQKPAQDVQVLSAAAPAFVPLSRVPDEGAANPPPHTATWATQANPASTHGSVATVAGGGAAAGAKTKKGAKTAGPKVAPSPPKIAKNKAPPAATPNNNKKKKKKEAPLAAQQPTLLLNDTSNIKDRIGEGGEEHELMRLFLRQHKGFGTQSALAAPTVVAPGRQRIRPKRKHFTALKKKVLEERLKRWRAQHEATTTTTATAEAKDHTATTVCVYGLVEPDELEDDDEYQELVSNFQDLADKVGPCRRLWIPREGATAVARIPAYCEFAQGDHAMAAVDCWNVLVLGGQALQAKLLILPQPLDDIEESMEKWQKGCLEAEQQQEQQQVVSDPVTAEATSASVESSTVRIALEHALTQDDLEDEECLEESLQDIRALASQFGTVVSVTVEQENVLVEYQGDSAMAETAAAEWNKTVLGGVSVSARVMGSLEQVSATASASSSLILLNVLTEDDLEDEDCLEESMQDIRELAQQFGTVQSIELGDEETVGRGGLVVVYSSADEANRAREGLDGMVIGGSTVSATLPAAVATISKLGEEQTDDKQTAVESKEPETMYSGDKVIPERFAECKRAPKVAVSQGARNYAVLTNDETVKELLTETLGELMRLQRRAMEDKNAKARRRLVMGLREVARGIRAHKVKMVVMANNLDDYGVIDDKLQEIIDLCHQEGVPIFFEFSKRGLGKALGKSIKVAVVGIQNADGANQQFKKLLNKAPAVPASST